MDFDLWLEFEEYADGYPGPQDDPLCDSCNIAITVGSRKYAANVWTFGLLNYCRMHDNDTGSLLVTPCSYLIPPDLLVEQLSRKTIEDAIRELLKADAFPEHWLVTG